MALLLVVVVAAVVVARRDGGNDRPVTREPDGEQFSFDENIDGRIGAPGEGDRFGVQLDAGDRIVASVRPGPGLDPELLATDPGGDLVGRDDDGGGGVTPLLVIEADRSGRYGLEVRGVGDSTGAYALQVELLGEDEQPPVAGPTQVAVGDTVDGEVVVGTKPAVYGLDLVQDELAVLVVRAADPDVDLELTVRDEAGDEVGYADYGADAFDPEAGPDDPALLVVAPADGRYLVEVGAYDADQTGAFTLTVQPGPEGVEPGGQSTDVQVGDRVESWLLGDETVDEFRFTARRGDAVAILAVAGSGPDPTITLLGPDGEVVAEDDDGAGDIDPDAGTFDAGLLTVLPADGEYTVEVGNLSGSGPYVFRIDEVDPAEIDGPGGPVQPGSVVEGGLQRSGGTDTYTLAGTAGQLVTLVVEPAPPADPGDASGALDPTVAVLDPDGALLASNDDADPSLGLATSTAAAVTVTLPVTGTYTVEVGAYDGTGPYRLTVR
ncbi:MAG: PPC domain-containing protein [Acidimicrobiales bacterium]|nr:PPC domain-containing protein [Acidimicrobiales bacterium]